MEYQKLREGCYPEPPRKHDKLRGPSSNFMLTLGRVGLRLPHRPWLLPVGLQHQLLGLQHPPQPCVLVRSLNFIVAP